MESQLFKEFKAKYRGRIDPDVMDDYGKNGDVFSIEASLIKIGLERTKYTIYDLKFALDNADLYKLTPTQRQALQASIQTMECVLKMRTPLLPFVRNYQKFYKERKMTSKRR